MTIEQAIKKAFAGGYDGRYDVFLGYKQADYDRAIQFGVQKRKITIKL